MRGLSGKVSNTRPSRSLAARAAAWSNSGVGLIGAIAFPLIMLVGGIYAWKLAKRESAPKPPDKQAWRDDSLDEWRTTREAEIEVARTTRAELAEKGQFEGGSTGDGGDTKRQQRIGG